MLKVRDLFLCSHWGFYIHDIIVVYPQLSLHLTHCFGMMKNRMTELENKQTCGTLWKLGEWEINNYDTDIEQLCLNHEPEDWWALQPISPILWLMESMPVQHRFHFVQFIKGIGPWVSSFRTLRYKLNNNMETWETTLNNFKLR